MFSHPRWLPAGLRPVGDRGRLVWEQPNTEKYVWQYPDAEKSDTIKLRIAENSAMAIAMAKEVKPFEQWKFAQKRDEWMRRLAMVPQSQISSGAKLVAFRLSLYMWERQRRAFPSYEELGLDCGMSARIVQEHTKALEQWVEVSRKRNRGNTYWLKYPFVNEDGYVHPLPKRSWEDEGDE